MNIDDLTLGQAKQLVALFRSSNGGSAEDIGTVHDLGKYVVVRTYAAGVHTGILAEKRKDEVVLRDSRRIWSWTGALSCSEIAMNGITGGKVAVALPEITLANWIEIIPTTKEAEQCLRQK